MYCKVRPICSIRISLIIAIFVMRKYSSITAFTIGLHNCAFGYYEFGDKNNISQGPSEPFSENRSACKKSQVQQLVMKLKSHSYFMRILKKV